jgi:hypothetical protein
MELALNLVWALLATLMYWLWMRHAPREYSSRQMQLVALAVVILILLPVISVTDDVQTLQNTAELDCCARRHHAVASAHSIFPAAAALPPPVIAELTYGFLRFSAPGNRPAPLVKIPALASIQNRPPPVA